MNLASIKLSNTKKSTSTTFSLRDKLKKNKTFVNVISCERGGEDGVGGEGGWALSGQQRRLLTSAAGSGRCEVLDIQPLTLRLALFR